ncbi:Listeria-Bacteroides repeat domain (List Bact rpt) [Bifidobacterium ramosum]|uniref:Alpha-amylase n=1 Tax=Bifidobacterium ramosum TaxID=1798158 RepID=A0A6L4WYB9_9BIFI|nr:InlB B-repeat-containing protein [Bifidobacterium ramosum]KAB8287288.1 Listeria-Bacteroides repeat domain (List Bact rpt) [Bifidobacterium ramosum]NEG72443.1 hypothetical protein [Bifidobacterium ramosum]
MIERVRKMAAALIGVAMAISGAAATSVAAAADETNKTATTQTTAATKALNNSDVTIIAFQQSWNTIAKECTSTYGPEGVGYVQISPPEESVQGTEWWTVYQPISYSLNSRFGTEDDLKNMITTCNAAGVQIIADVVLNHTSGHDVSWVEDQLGVAGTKYNGTYGRYPGIGIYQYEESGNNHQYGLASGDFHACRDNIADYTDVKEVQECRLLTMWDINTGSERVQNIQAEYLAKLWELGVRGFRIDSAKHISTNDLAGIKAKLATKIGVATSAIPFQQEVIYHQGEAEELAPKNYISNGDVTEFSYSYQLRQYFNGDISNLKNISNGLLPSDKATVFVSNWDTARGSETLTVNSGSRYELATAFMLAYDYGKPKVMSDYYFASDNSDAGPNGTTDTRTPDVDFDAVCKASSGGTSTAVAASVTDRQQGDWLCEQRWASVRGMIGFHNAVSGTKVGNWQNNGTNNIGFARVDGDGNAVGFMAINNTLKEHKETYDTGLPDGEYCDVYSSGDTCNKVTVKDGKLTVTIGKRSAVAIYKTAPKPNDWKGYSTTDSGYDDQVDTGRIGDTTSTIYYRNTGNWSNVYIQYAVGDTLLNGEPVKMDPATASVDGCATDGWYAITLPKGVNTQRIRYRFTDGNGNWDYHSGTSTDAANGTPYENAVGTAITAIDNHDETIGVPFTCAVSAKTTFTVHFADATAAQQNASGVVVWGDGLNETYYPFDKTEDSDGKRMTAEIDGDHTTLQYRIVASKATKDKPVDGTMQSYSASVIDKTDGNVVSKVRGSIEAWVDGSDGKDYDSSNEARHPASVPQPNDVKNPKKLTITVHYMRADANYQEYDLDSDSWKGWDLWTWSGEQTGSPVQFTSHDDYGMIATYTLTQNDKGNRRPEYILRMGGDSWSGKDPDNNDHLIPESAITVPAGQVENGTAEIWLISGDPTIYTHRPAVSGVTFKTMFDWNVSPQAVPYGGTVAELDPRQVPQRPGYAFLGWSTNTNGPVNFTLGVNGTPVTKRLKLWAQYAKANTITFDSQGGSAVAMQTVQDGQKTVEPTAPTRDGYTFRGWSTTKDGTNADFVFGQELDGDLTLYAVWTINQYTVTFDSQGGSAVAPATVDHGNSVDAPAAPTKSGMDFVGWVTDDGKGNPTDTPYNFDAPVNGDLTLHAKWVTAGTKVHLVTFHRNDATDASGDTAEPVTIYVEDGKAVAEPSGESTRDGYRFAGWTTDKGGVTPYDFSKPVAGNLDLYVHWVKTWTVSFDLNYDGATGIDAQTVDDSNAGTTGHDAVEPAEPSRDKYRFMGWYADKALTAEFEFGKTPVTGDITLYAKWEKAGTVWTIKFDLNGGTAADSSDSAFAAQRVYDGEKLIKPTKNPASWTDDKGVTYTFQGWTTVRNDALAGAGADGSFTGGSAFGFAWNKETNRYESLIPIDRNGTLYALWAKNTTTK